VSWCEPIFLHAPAQEHLHNAATLVPRLGADLGVVLYILVEQVLREVADGMAGERASELPQPERDLVVGFGGKLWALALLAGDGLLEGVAKVCATITGIVG